MTFNVFGRTLKLSERKSVIIDFDLNRSVGPMAMPKGYEKKRVAELAVAITGNFDFAVDLHTTTSNMGLTCILSNDQPESRKLATYLTKTISGLQVIEEDNLNHGSVHLNRLCPAGVIIEVGPVANNVISAELVFKTREIVESILNFDFNQNHDNKLEVVKVTGQQFFLRGHGIYTLNLKVLT
jgi:succinylglutamate desuccinylase